MSETPHHHEEGWSPEDDTRFGFPSAGSTPEADQSSETAMERAAYTAEAQERVAALSPETKNGISQATNDYLAIRKQSLDFANSWPDLVETAERDYQELVDTYTAYKSGNVDEEELRAAIIATRERLATSRAQMDPDAKERPSLNL